MYSMTQGTILNLYGVFGFPFLVMFGRGILGLVGCLVHQGLRDREDYRV